MGGCWTGDVAGRPKGDTPDGAWPRGVWPTDGWLPDTSPVASGWSPIVDCPPAKNWPTDAKLLTSGCPPADAMPPKAELATASAAGGRPAPGADSGTDLLPDSPAAAQAAAAAKAAADAAESA